MRATGLFVRAVRVPQRITAADVREWESSLSIADTDATKTFLRTLLALAFSRPDLVPASIVHHLKAVLLQPNAIEPIAPLLKDVLCALISTTLDRVTYRLTTDLLMRPDVFPETQTLLIQVLEYVLFWNRPLIEVGRILDIVEQSHFEEVRARVVSRVVEPCLLAGVPSEDLVCRLRSLRQGDPSSPYALASIVQRCDLPAAVRHIAREAVHDRFPLANLVGTRLCRGETHVMAINNIPDAQGDEIIRVVPLLQALLDCNPQTHVRLITGRPYLYCHPRISTIAIDHGPAVAVALQGPCDVLVNWYHPDLNGSRGLERSLPAYRSRYRPFLSLGSTTGGEANVYDHVEVNGRPWAQRLGLDQPRISNLWEPAWRLLLDLGLPVRTGEQVPQTPVVAGIACPDADSMWAEAVRSNIEGRPVALVNPFGGHEVLKGYVEQNMHRLLDRLAALVDDGFYVVLLPSGMPWGAAHVVESIVRQLPPEKQGYVVVGPDPHCRAGSATCECSPAPLPYRSSVMRHTLALLQRVDLIVAVEGWTIHAAYVLGKPYQVLTMAYSLPGPNAWLPFVSTSRQVIAENRDVRDPGKLADDVPQPPLEEQPRVLTLRALLRELGESVDADLLPPLQKALSSPDRLTRLAAIRSLSRYHTPIVHRLLLERVADTCSEVRGAAAQALLETGLDWSHSLGSTYEGQLRTHVTVAALAWDLKELTSDRAGTRIALQLALKDDYESVRREASKWLRLLDYYRDGTPPRARLWIRRPSIPRLRTTRTVVPQHCSGQDRPSILILTPLKDAEISLERYRTLILRLTYPRARVSLGFLESDSTDRTYSAMCRTVRDFRRSFRRVDLWKHDFHYQIPPGYVRGDVAFQMQRRQVLAESRNLLLGRALRDEDWVLWLDADVDDYPPDVIDRLLAPGKDIITPHCVLEYGGPTFDRNAWRDRGALHLEDLRSEGDVVRLDAVGGTMLLVRADLHRRGLQFPASLYGAGNPLCRDEVGEIETEGLGIMAHDMGYRCWGMPRLEIRHRDA